MKRLIVFVALGACGGGQARPAEQTTNDRASPVADPTDERPVRLLTSEGAKDDTLARSPETSSTVHMEGETPVLGIKTHPACFDVATDPVLCAADTQRCIGLAVRLQIETTCSEVPFAACFLTTHTLSGTRDAWCTKTMRDCDVLRVKLGFDGDHKDTGKCFVMRHES